jgi:hypothetical protein
MFLKRRECHKDGETPSQLVDCGESTLCWATKLRTATYFTRVAERSGLAEGWGMARQISDSNRFLWVRPIAVFDERAGEERQLALFPEDRTPPTGGMDCLQMR